MSLLHYVHASDINHKFCFLDVSKDKDSEIFMDIRISENRELSFCIYKSQEMITLSLDEWAEIHSMALSFYTSELENEKAFDDWDH